MAEVEIRRFRPEDRDAVRHICFVTGYMGEPVEWMWRDQESFADMFSGYYTDREPESTLVADIGGKVQGYLLGCRESSRAWNPAAVAGRHMVRRGFRRRGEPVLVPGERTRDGARTHIQTMVQALG